MAGPTEHAETLFEMALGFAASERSAFLDRECADDPGLRRAVEDLLSADAAAGNFLRDPLLDLPTVDHGEAPKGTIGPYQLLQVIGQGGMGEVWLAEQRQPVRRRVAIKLIKVGVDTREVVARLIQSGKPWR